MRQQLTLDSDPNAREKNRSGNERRIILQNQMLRFDWSVQHIQSLSLMKNQPGLIVSTCRQSFLLADIAAFATCITRTSHIVCETRIGS